MSGWMNLTRGLYDLGGGPLRLPAFSHTCENERPSAALRDAQRVGTIRRADTTKYTRGVTYEITPIGEGFAEGRYRVSRQRGSKKIALVPVMKDVVPDHLIERLLLEAGQQPGDRVTPDVLREFSNRLARIITQTVVTL